MKHTSGGTFDPNEEFIYFLAGSTTDHLAAVEKLPDENVYAYPHILTAVNELESKGALDAFDRLLDSGRVVLLDSGVFNLAMTHARKHDVSHDVALSLPPDEVDGFDQLLERYYEVATRFADRLWGVIEVDQGGAKVKPHTRARIEAESGIVPMPVWHPLLDGVDYYRGLVAEYDRLCVGNLVKANPSLRVRIIARLAELSADHPDTWHHLLGVTQSELNYSLPIHGSSDSSTWLAGSRWPMAWRSRSMGRALLLFGVPYYYVDKDYIRSRAIAQEESASEMQTIRTYLREEFAW